MKILKQLLVVLGLILSIGSISPNAYALSILLDGTRTVLSGTDCDIATYRFGTTASWNGTPIDLHVEVNAEDNEFSFGNCLYVSGGVLSANLHDKDPSDDVAFIDITVTLVQQGTLIPVAVDRITATGFDLDANGTATGQFSTGTDDIYLSGPGAAYLSGITNVTYSQGSWPIGHDVKLKGDPAGNCSDTPTTPVAACRGSSSWTGGASNSVSTFNARFQNDNAYGQYLGTGNAYRLLQLSLDDSHAEAVLGKNNDHGDAPASYGDASHPVLSLYTILGNGLAADHETANQPGAGADGDDTTIVPGVPSYDDEDAVKRGGVILDDQTLTAGAGENLTITTFGDGYLSGWIDFNGDGDFFDAGEKVVSDTYVNSTTVSVTPVSFTVPLGAAGGFTYARFRFNKTTGVGPTGLGDKGEVEDYRVEIDPMTPAYNMVKSASPSTFSAPGTLTYTFTFTNTGNVTLQNLNVVDGNIDAGSVSGCPIASLAVGATASCTATRTVTQNDIDAGSALTNTAFPSAEDPLGGSAAEDDTSDNSTATPVTPVYTLGIDKAFPTHTDGDYSGDVSEGDSLTYVITATNTGTGTLSNVIVSDAMLTPNSQACAIVAPLDTCVLTGSYTVAATDVTNGSINNTASAKSDQTGKVSDSQTVPLPSPAQTLSKPAPVNADEDGSGDVSVGDTLTYTITMTNTGSAVLTGVVVSDPMLTPSSVTCTSVAPGPGGTGGTCVLIGTYVVTATDITNGSIDNVASSDTDQTDPVTDDETVAVPTPSLIIDKPAPASADGDNSLDVSAGDVLTYTITATNNGTSTLTNVVVSDPLITPNSNTCATVTAGGTCVLVGTYTVQSGDVTAGSIDNTASADSDQTGPVDDSETVPVPAPSHTIAKSISGNADEDGSGDISVSDTLSYTVTATNNGTAILTNLIVSDPMLTPNTLTCASVSPGATCVLVGTYSVTAADITAGVINNTASAVSDQTSSLDDTETVNPPMPSLVIDKPAPSNNDIDGSGDISSGDVLTYTITATNNGTANLTNVVVSDPMLTPGSNTCAFVAAGGTCVLSGTYTVTNADVAAGSIVNTATADSDQTGSVDDDETVPLLDPELVLDKAAPTNADEDGSSDVSVGDTLTYTITATNNGSATLTNVVVSDPLLTPASITCASIAPGATCVLTGSYQVQGSDVSAGSIVNTATADSDQTDPTDDTETVNTPSPSHTIDKAAPSNADNDNSGDVSVGDVLTYTITATNNGTATLTNLIVSDPLLTPSSMTCASVPAGPGGAGGTCVLVGTYTVTAADITAGTIDNTASSSSDQTSPLTDDENVPVPTPSLSLDKAAPLNADGDSSGDVSAGDILTYTITATNNGSAVLTNLVVSDPMLSPNSNTCATVAPSATCILVGDYTVVATDVTAGVINNTATADSDQTGPIDDTETVNVPSPSHTLDKPAPVNGDQDNSADVSVGDVLTYTVTATNNGTAVLTNLVVSDNLITPASQTCASVVPGATCVLVGTYTVTSADVTAGSILNTAVSDSDQTGTETDDETVTLPTPSHVLDKAAPVNADNDTSGDLSVGDVLTYTITATNNGTATLTNMVVNDSMITPSSNTCATVAPSSTCVLTGTYTVTAADITAGSITNTAQSDTDQTGKENDSETVNPPVPSLSIDKPAPVNGDQDGSGDVSVGDVLTYTITATNSGTANLTTVMVSDSIISPSSVTCALVTPGNTCVLSGTYTVTASDITAGSIVNTATADSDQTESVTDDETVNTPNPSHTLDKPAPLNADNDSSGDVSVGDVLTYIVTATNNGTATLTNLTVNDPMLTPASVSCASTAPGATCVLSGTYVVSAADLVAGSIDNTATSASDQTESVDDDQSVNLNAPSHSLDKSVPVNADNDSSGDLSAGDVLTYTITATNNGSANLTNMLVSDSLIMPSAITCPLLTPGAVCVLTGTYTLTAADVIAGLVTNTASSVTDQTGNIDDEVTINPPSPALSIDKQAPTNSDEDNSGDVSAGDTLNYTIVATNSGTAALTNLVVTDNLITPNSNTCTLVAPGATCVLSGTYSVTAADVAAGTIDNTATAESDQTESVDDDETVAVPSPSHTLSKGFPANADNDGSGDVSLNDVLTYTITATNNGTATLTNMIVADPLLTPGSTTCLVVAPGATCVLTGTYTVDANDIAAGSIDNTATSDTEQTGPENDTQTVNLDSPSHTLDKAAPVNADNDGTSDISAGDTLTYTITATNNGASNLTNMVVSDPMLTPSTTTCALVIPGNTCVLTGTYVVSGTDISNGVITNTASSDTDQTDEVTDTEVVNPPTPAMTLDKAAPANSDEDASTDVSVGDTLTYTITATNTGTAVLTGVVVTDPMIVPTSTTCASMTPGATCVLIGTYTVTAANVATGSITNTATADSDQTDELDDSELVVIPEPSHTLSKAVPVNADEDSSGDISAGDTLTYTITANNNGTATLTNLVVSDPMISPSTTTCASVAPGANCVLVGVYTVTATDVANTIIVNTATSDSDQTGELDDDQTLNLNEPSHTLDKSAPTNADDDSSLDISVGDTLTYTITATNNGSATLTNLLVSDPMLTPSSQSCASVAPGATCVLVGAYSVTPADATAGVINNTATSGSDQTGSVDDSAQVTVPVPSIALDKATPVNTDEDSSSDVSVGDTLTYTVTATNNGTANLTNVVVNDPLLSPSSMTCALMLPGDICVLTGTYSVTLADVTAGVIDNTATTDSDQTDEQSDDESVNLPAPVLALDKAAPAHTDQDGTIDISVGDVLTYTITATNNGSAVLTNVTVSDPMLSPGSVTCATVAPSATCVLTGVYSVQASDVTAGAINNTATAGSDQTGDIDDSEVVVVPSPALSIDKSAPVNTDEDTSGDISVGDTLTYTVTATNTGTANLTALLVSDPMLTPSSQTCALVQPGNTCILSGTYVVTVSDIIAGTIVNTASADSDQTDPAEDMETVTPPTPSHTLDKAVPVSTDNDASGDISAGDTLTYTITATNNGTATLTNLVISDPMISPSSNTCAVVAPAATCSLTGTYTVTAGDIVNGSIVNTATSDSDQTDPVDDDQTQNLAGPSHTISKAFSANADEDGSTDISVGDTLTYTITATNNGSANLSNMVVSDPMLTPSTITCATMVPGDTCVLVGTYSVTAGDVSAGAINNTASSDTDQTESQSDSETVIPPTPSVQLDKAAPTNADEDSSSDISVGDTLTYTITATNNGTAVLTNLIVSDPMLTPASTTCALLLPGASCVLSGVYVVAPGDLTAGDITNTATADSDQTDPVEDIETTNLSDPGMTLDKSAPVNADEDGSTDISVGDSLTYTITATNTGATTLTNVVVNDPMLVPASTTCASVPVGGNCVLSGVYTVQASDITAGAIVNTATADSDQTEELEESETVVMASPAIDLTKSLVANADEDASGDISAGDTLTYSAVATNTGSSTLTNVVVSDPMITPSSQTCATLAPLDTCVVTGVYTVTAADLAAGSINNTASVNSDQADPLDDSLVINLAAPALDLVKAAPANADNDNSGDLSVGDVLTYTVTATNTGGAVLTGVVVNDPLLTPASKTCASVAPAGTCVLVGTYTVTANDVSNGVVVNTATGDSDQTGEQSDTDTQPISNTPEPPQPPQVQPALVLVKALAGNVDEDGSGSVSLGDTLQYTATASNTGGIDLTNVVVSDSMLSPNSITCALLTPGQSCVLAGTYSVTLADATAGVIVNTATSNSDQTGGTSDSVNVPVDAPPENINPPVTTDNSAGNQPLTQPVTMDVLGDDSDPENNIDPTTVQIIDPATGNPVTTLVVPGEGVWTVDPVTGAITFTPEDGFVNDPTPIDYVVSDTTGLMSNPSTVTIEYEEPVSLTGIVWLDTDRDGEYDDGEQLLPGWTLVICDADGNEVATTTTDENGFYSVEGLPPGEYTVKFFDEEGVFYADTTTDGPIPPGGTVDLPLQVEPGVAMILNKTVSPSTASIGDLVMYQIRVRNQDDVDGSISISDDIPAGFSYVNGSALWTSFDGNGVQSGQDVAAVTGTDPLSINNLQVPATGLGEIVVSYTLRVGATARAGDAVNTAVVSAGGNSNTSSAVVGVVAEPVVQRSTIVGKVFHDRDKDGFQDDADATGISIGSEYFGWSSYKAGRINGRTSELDDPATRQLVINMPVTADNRFTIATKEGTRINVANDGTVTESHVGDRAHGRTAQDIRVSTRMLEGLPASSSVNNLDPDTPVPVVEITLRNVGIHEEGIPGVRVANVEGLLMETDEHGRFHVPDAESGNYGYGQQYLLKVDRSTLPDGAKFTTENPRLLRISNTALNTYRFGVVLPEQARSRSSVATTHATKGINVTLGSVFFDTDMHDVRDDQTGVVQDIINRIREFGRGHILIEAHTDSRHNQDYNIALAERRAKTIHQELVKALGSEIMQNVLVEVDQRSYQEMPHDDPRAIDYRGAGR